MLRKCLVCITLKRSDSIYSITWVLYTYIANVRQRLSEKFHRVQSSNNTFMICIFFMIYIFNPTNFMTGFYKRNCVQLKTCQDKHYKRCQWHHQSLQVTLFIILDEIKIHKATWSMRILSCTQEHKV